MTTMIRKGILILLISCLPGIITAQDDFGMWFATNIDYGLFKKVDFKFTGSIRTFNNTSQIEQSFFELGLQYKLSKNFSLSGSYRFTNSLEDNDRYYYRHKLMFDLNSSVQFNNLSVSARGRVQRMTRTYIENEDDLLAQYTARIKIKTAYRLPGIPIKPYVSFESFTDISPEFGPFIGKYRFSAGAEFKVTRVISIDAGYIIQRDYVPNINNEHIVSVDINFKF